MNHIDLTQGNVTEKLLKLSIPVIATSLLQMSYNAIDMLLVGRLGSESVAAVGVASFLIMLIHAIQAMVLVGTGIMVSHALGEKNEKKQHQNINASFRLNFIFAWILVITAIIMGPAFIRLMNVDNPEVKRLAYHYLLASALGIFFTLFNLWYSRIYNSFGLNEKAFKISALGFIVNIFLAVLFIYIFDLGVIGAGLSTVGAHLIMVILFFNDSKNLFCLDLNVTIPLKIYIKVLKLGFPIAIQRILFSLVNITLGTMIASFGTTALAAQKIGLQIESILIVHKKKKILE